MGWRHRDTRHRVAAFLVACAGVVALPRVLDAQSQYFNLDGGRPTRIDDAEATERYALAIDLLPIRWEHFAAGINRLQTEPRLTYGVLPFTDVELRVPIVGIIPPRGSGARTTTGAAGLALGSMHAFNLETPTLPAMAIAGEVSLPVGTLAPPSASYLAKFIATRTTRWGRFHLNAGAGRYSARTASTDTASCSANPSNFSPGSGAAQPCGGPPIIVDAPCDLGMSTESAAPRFYMSQQSVAGASRAPKSAGAHWLGSLGFDHSFALASTIMTADIIGEQFAGLYTKTDWTSEVGLRKQITPLLVLDAGAGWHFAGTYRSTILTMGAAYDIALPPLGAR